LAGYKLVPRLDLGHQLSFVQVAGSISSTTSITSINMKLYVCVSLALLALSAPVPSDALLGAKLALLKATLFFYQTHLFAMLN